MEFSAASSKFTISAVTPSKDGLYRIEILMGKVGFKTQVKSTEDVIVTSRTTAAVLVADKLQQAPIVVIASYSKDLTSLTKAIETAFKENPASVTETIFKLPEIIEEVSSLVESLKNGSSQTTAAFTDIPLVTGTASASTASVTSEAGIQVLMLTPASGATFLAGGEVLLLADATDSLGAITRVEFYLGNSKVGVASDTPYKALVNNVAAGNYLAHAKAFSSSGASKVSAAVPMKVYVEPVLTFSQPEADDVFWLGEEIPVTVVPSNVDVGSIKVEFFDADTKIGEALQAPFSMTLKNASAGIHLLTAKILPAGDSELVRSVISAPLSFGVYDKPNRVPQVAFASPTGDLRLNIGSDVTLNASASDPDGFPVKVAYYLGFVKLGEVASAPYTFVWKSPAIGTYTVTAKVTDNQGADMRSTSINVYIVAPDNVAPVVNILYPPQETAFVKGERVAVTAAAYDTDGTITRVEFYDGDRKVGEDSQAPFTTSFILASEGYHLLSALAVDNKGLKTTSGLVRIKGNANATPTIVIENPPEGATPQAGKDITITVDALDRDGSIQRVEFFANGVKIGEESVAPFDCLYRGIPAQTVALTAVAFDNLGVSAVSPVVTIKPW
jgi:hypothetical protein